jgi:hypothetical protein
MKLLVREKNTGAELAGKKKDMVKSENKMYG